jgi:HSP20 family protein
MTIYVTPFTRSARRRWMEHMMQDNDMPEMMENQVYFPVDVAHEADSFVVTALLPGVGPDDLNIQIVNETVSIQGELKHDRDEKTEYLLRELPEGRFSRVLNLPAPLDSTKAEANLENGVLTLRVPKAETARPKSIKVQTKS